MDSITQGVLGAAAAQMIFGGPGRLGRKAWFYGCIGGTAPDLDVFIRSATDPLVALEYHRHFTHSFFMIPIGGTIAALPWALLPRNRAQGPAIIAATTAGYATHALLDAFTSYGTMVLWPFSSVRVAWNWIAIVDLGYTLPLFVGVILAARRRAPRYAVAALVACNLYLALCGLQRWRARAAQDALVAMRGHHANRVEVFPTLLNHVTWRSLYVDDGVVYADKIRVPWFAPARVTPGGSVPLVGDAQIEPAVLADPRTRRGYEVFAWFSDGWMASPAGEPRTLGDLRYAVLPGDLTTLWQLHLDPGGAEPVRFVRDMPRDVSPGLIWRALFEDGAGAHPIPPPAP